MKFFVNPTRELSGTVRIPGNKSGTARGIILGALAEGESTVTNPLLNLDSFSIIDMMRALGAEIDTSDPLKWKIRGTGGKLQVPKTVLDAGNSGTGYYMLTGIAGLLEGCAVVSGDYQICYRPAGPLVDALNALGAHAVSTRNNGLAPLVISGKLKGGYAELEGVNSQWLTPLLVAGALAEGDTEIREVSTMHERPYVDMTIGMMKQAGVEVVNDNYETFRVKGNQTYRATDFVIPGDWGSAGYPMVAAAITGSTATFMNLNDRDYAGERAYADILEKMGCKVEIRNGGKDGVVISSTGELQGIEIDCSGMPDAVPALAVLGCVAKGKTVLTRIKSTRLKETDRAATIRKELEKMGGRFEETEDTMTIYHSDLKGAFIDGHHDHRIVMATAVAALVADGPTIISDSEYAAVSFPEFYDVMRQMGAKIERLETV